MAFPDTTFTTGTTITSNWLNAVNDKCVELVSIKDFGAVGDGITDDSAAIQTAVSSCILSGGSLYWPIGTYVTSANINNFHSITHFGSGIVTRNGNLFYISGRGTNNLYVSPTGSASNDGLSNSQPMTLSSVCAVLPNWALQLAENGTFKVNLAAGIYSGGIRMFGLRSKNRIWFIGPDVGGHPNVPTAIIDGTANSDPYGLYFQQYMYVYVQDIKIQNVTAGGIPIGLAADQHTNLQTKNVHTAGCGYAGVSADSMCYLYLEAGIHNNPGYGVRVYSGCTYTIGYQGSAGANRPQITGASLGYAGILITNASQGHVDYTDIYGCSGSGGGLQIVNQSRTDLVGCTFGAGTPNYYNIRMDVYSTYINNYGNTLNPASARSVVSWGGSINNAAQTSIYYDETLASWRFGPTTNIIPKVKWHYQYSEANVSYNSSVLIALEDSANPYFGFGSDNPSGEAGFMWAKPGSTIQGKFYYNYLDDTFRMLVNGSSDVYRWSSTYFSPPTDNSVSNGSSAYRWSTVYAGTGTINTSDAREKQDVGELTAAEVRVAKSLKQLVRKFRFKDAVEKKGDDARIHFGVIAQDVKSAFEHEGLDAFRYALLCWDEWAEQPEELDEHGNVITPYRPAGNRYGVRYDELMAFIIGAM